MKPKIYLTGALSLVLFLTVFTEDVEAIPAFARKYKTSCATCHEAFPRLNSVGEAYRLNGYKYADDELYIKEEPVEMGDDAYKRLWPSAIWPADIPGLPPISVTLDSDAAYDLGGTESAVSEFKFPRQAKVLGAAAIGDNISTFVEFGFSRNGSGDAGHHGGTATDEGTETTVEGWIQFEDLFWIQNAFNLRAGTLGMHEIGLFTARGHNRFSVSNYLYSSWAMPSPGGHNIDDLIPGITGHHGAGGGIDYDGNPFTIHAQPGAEINGFGKSWRYAVGVVNGNGEKLKDNNNEKDVYLQLAYKIGGLGFDGTGMGDGDGLGSASDPWRDDSLTLSLFGYYGTSPVEIEREADDFESSESDRFWRIGPGLLWRIGDLQLGGGYIWGNNEQPFGTATNRSVDSTSWFVEAHYFVKPWLIPYARYESLELDLPAAVSPSWPDGADKSRVVVGSKMLIRANVTLGLEGLLYVKDDREDSDNDNSMLIASLRFGF